ncbi:FKBP-type peptidyl-prolyl cis-trans isomerase [Massilia niabensis]
MKLTFLAAACAVVLSLSACGGGGDDDSVPAVAVASPATLIVTDSVVGTGAVATAGKRLTVTYTGWLYSTTAVNNKGTQFDSGTISFPLGQGAVIPGWDQGLAGMKVGGKRTLAIPASLAYGRTGNGSIPPDAGLVFDVELIRVE